MFAFSRRTALTLLPSAAALMAVTSCASDDPAPEVPAASDRVDTGEWTIARTMPPGMGSGESDGTFPRTVKHFLGESTIEAEPQRVIVLATGQADALVTHGLPPIAATVALGAELVPDYLRDAHPDQVAALEQMTDLGARGEPNAEAIAALEPDLILMNATGDAKPDTYQRLSAIAPVVATQGTGLHWKEDFLLLSDALGRTEAAQTWLDDYHGEAARFGDSVDGAPSISLLRRNGDRIRIFQVASFSGSVVEDIGLARPESQSATDATSEDISNEQLSLADGDWIFYAVQGDDLDQLTGLPLWSGLQAVTEDRAVPVDDDAFCLNAGPTAARHILAQLEESLG